MPSVFKSSMPKNINQKGMIKLVSVKCDLINWTSMSAQENRSEIHYVPANCDRITCTSMSA